MAYSINNVNIAINSINEEPMFYLSIIIANAYEKFKC